MELFLFAECEEVEGKIGICCFSLPPNQPNFGRIIFRGKGDGQVCPTYEMHYCMKDNITQIIFITVWKKQLAFDAYNFISRLPPTTFASRLPCRKRTKCRSFIELIRKEKA